MISYHPTAREAREAVTGFIQIEAVEMAMSSGIWAGICWRGGRRKEAEFIFSDVCVMDFDDGQMTLDEAVKTFTDCEHWIGTTRSHQKAKGDRAPCDRFRVAIPWVSRIDDLRTYKFNMIEMTKRYPVDPQCKDAARLFYPCVELVSVSFDGYRQPVLAPPHGFGKYDSSAAMAPGVRSLPAHVMHWLKWPAKPGQLRATYFKIGAALSQFGHPLPDAIELVRRSRVGENATAADPLAELVECVRSGWYRHRSNGGK